MKSIIICDIDGTIAKLDHRLHFLKNKDYINFFDSADKDEPIYPIINLIHYLANIYSIYFVSGRSDICRDKTEKWLNLHVGINYKVLIMRPHGNHKPDWLIKEQILKQHFNLDDIAYVLDDRNQVVEMWRKHGLTVLQVANGDF